MSTGLRERKKAATRQALHDAAVRLATERGVENLTVEAIADAATVSRRTFSNYFASKEQALLHRDRASIARLVESVRARPPSEAPLTALVRAAGQLGTGYTPGREERYWELRRHPALLAEMVAVYAAAEADLAEAIRERLPADPVGPLRARVIAATFLAALRVAGQSAFDHLDADYVDLLHQAIALAREGFTEDESRAEEGRT